MKNMIRLTAVMMLCTLTFVGCTKDEDAKFEKSIVGTWKLIHYWSEEDGYEDIVGEDGQDTWIFEKEGKGIWRYIDGDNHLNEESFVYFISNSTIRVVYNYGNPYEQYEKYKIESISSKKMKWIGVEHKWISGPVYPMNDKLEFKKVD